jgi:ABC-2 type transport system permease protein
MSLRRLLAIARKEFHHITRDVRTLFLVTVVPALLLVLLANIFSFDADSFRLVVLDLDKTDLSRGYLADLTSDATFHIAAYVDRYEDIDAWLQSGRAHLALVIPAGTEAALRARQPAPAQAILDGVDVIGARQILGQLDVRTQMFSLKLMPTIRRPMPGVLDVRTRTWYNLSARSLNSMVPGLMAVVLYMPALALSLSLARERELGSFEGLVATPLRGFEYLFGKTLAYIGFGLASTLPVIWVSTFWFHVTFQGNLFEFLVLAACYFLASFGLSQVVGSFIKNQQTAMLVMIMVFFVPSFFLAGLILPVDTSSLWTRLTAYSLPVTHFILICRGVFLKGMTIVDLAGPALILLSISGSTLVLSLILFRKWVE